MGDSKESESTYNRKQRNLTCLNVLRSTEAGKNKVEGCATEGRRRGKDKSVGNGKEVIWKKREAERYIEGGNE